MKYRILQSFNGSPDGSLVIAYAAGDVVEMPESLSSVAVREGWAEAIDDETGEVSPPETATAAPQRRRKG